MRQAKPFTQLNSTQLPTFDEFTQKKLATIYSPFDGVTNDAYNVTAATNLRNTQGSISSTFAILAGALNVADYANFYTTRSCIGCDIPLVNTLTASLTPNVDGSVSTLTVVYGLGTVLFDEIAFHYVVDLDLYQGLN